MQNEIFSSSRKYELDFLKDWYSLTLNKKLKKYDKHMCSDINIFLYFKDKPFFNTYIKNFLRNKLQKTFVDYFLLDNENELKKFTKIEHFNQLNNLEKILILIYLKEKSEETKDEQQAILNLLKNKNNSQSYEKNNYKRFFELILSSSSEAKEEIKEQKECIFPLNSGEFSSNIQQIPSNIGNQQLIQQSNAISQSSLFSNINNNKDNSIQPATQRSLFSSEYNNNLGSQSNSERGLFGRQANTTGGNVGQNNNAGGSFGQTNNARGGFGQANNAGGVFGQNNNNAGGVFGQTNNVGGVFGQTNNAGGLFGQNNNAGGVFGQTNNAGGVFGQNNNAGGLFGQTNNARGVFGQTKNSGSFGFNQNNGLENNDIPNDIRLSQYKENKISDYNNNFAEFIKEVEDQRISYRQAFRYVQKTKEYEEMNFLSFEDLNINSFWVEFAEHVINNGLDKPFLSAKFIFSCRNRLEILASMCFTSLPFENQNHKYIPGEGKAMTIQIESQSIIFSKEIKETSCELNPDFFITQKFFDINNR